MTPRSLRATLRALIPVGALSLGIFTSPTVAQAAPTLEQQITEKSQALEKVVEEFNRTTEQLAATRAQIDTLQRAIPVLQAKANAARANINEIAQTAYQGAAVSGWNAILVDADKKQTLRRLSDLQRLADEQRKQVEAAATAAAKQQTAQRLLEEQLAAQDSRVKTLETQKKGIQAELDKLYELRRQAYGSATVTGSSYSGPIPEVSGSAGVAVRYAFAALGKPYVWAAAGPNGYDCSGLTLAAWREAGVGLSHLVETQWTQVVHIGRDQLQPGDLVFYSGLGHVGIYIGDGKVIHAPTFGDVVKISRVDMMPPYGYGRVRA